MMILAKQAVAYREVSFLTSSVLLVVRHIRAMYSISTAVYSNVQQKLLQDDGCCEKHE